MATTTAASFEELEKFSQGGGSQYIRFSAETPTFEGVYLGYEFEDDTFNPGEKKVVYHIEIDRERKMLSTGSKRLARAIIAAKPVVGEFIRVTRVGESFETDYKVETSELPF